MAVCLAVLLQCTAIQCSVFAAEHINNSTLRCKYFERFERPRGSEVAEIFAYPKLDVFFRPPLKNNLTLDHHPTGLPLLEMPFLKVQKVSVIPKHALH